MNDLALRPEALTTPDRAREFGLGLSGASDNGLILGINSISQAAMRYVGRPLYQITHTTGSPELIQGYGRETVRLRGYPVVEVEQVLVSDVEETGFSTADQFLREGLLYLEGGWPWSVSRYNDLTRDHNYSAPRYNLKVAYTGGYVTPLQLEADPALTGELLPDEIELAIIREVSELLNGGRSSGRILSERTVAGYAVTYAMSGVVNLSRETTDVLSGYALAVMP